MPPPRNAFFRRAENVRLPVAAAPLLRPFRGPPSPEAFGASRMFPLLGNLRARRGSRPVSPDTFCASRWPFCPGASRARSEDAPAFSGSVRRVSDVSASRRFACEMRIAFGFAGDAALRPAVSREVRYRPSSDVGRSAAPHCGGVHPPEIRAGPAAGADPRLPLPAAARKNPSCAGRFSARHVSNPVRHGARPHR